jgi:hypothetical protein
LRKRLPLEYLKLTQSPDNFAAGHAGSLVFGEFPCFWPARHTDRPNPKVAGD